MVSILLIRRVSILTILMLFSVVLVANPLFVHTSHAEEVEFVCRISQANPANETDDYDPSITANYLVWEAYDGADTEIFARNTSNNAVIQITNNNLQDNNPRIDGNYIVWQYVNPDNDTFDIALYDLSTGITDYLNPSTSQDLNPMIEGDYLVWTQNGILDRVQYYNIATDTIGGIGSANVNDKYDAYSLNNGRILYRYVDYNDLYNLYVYDIANGETTLITEELPQEDKKLNPSIHGDVVAWVNESAELTEVYAFDLESGTLTRITTDYYYDQSPAVYGSHVVYLKTLVVPESNHYEIHLYDLESQTDTIVGSAQNLEYYAPHINDTLIAWQSAGGIFAYHLERGLLTQVTDVEEGDDLSLLNNRIFWSGRTAGADNDDIFMADCGLTPNILQQPQDVQILSGETAMLSVVAEGDGTLSYQWFEGDATDSSAPIAGAKAATFVTPPLTENTTFWVRVSNGYGTIESAPAEVIVGQGTLMPGVTPTATLEVTPTPSMTPTEIAPGSIQILPNTSFEMDVDNNKIPDGWSAKGTQLNKADKLKRNKLQPDGTVKQFAYSGESAFMFKGNPGGGKSKIGYKLTDFGVITDNSRLEFSVYVNRFNVAPGTTVGKVKISFSDGSKETLELTTPTEQAYTSVSDLMLVDLDGRTIEKFKVEFSTNITGGKFMIDAASLLVMPGQVGEPALLPLP
jgi:beta propeller repeat protein